MMLSMLSEHSNTLWDWEDQHPIKDDAFTVGWAQSSVPALFCLN
jgi:hypothetical protein